MSLSEDSKLQKCPTLCIIWTNEFTHPDILEGDDQNLDRAVHPFLSSVAKPFPKLTDIICSLFSLYVEDRKLK